MAEELGDLQRAWDLLREQTTAWQDLAAQPKFKELQKIIDTNIAIRKRDLYGNGVPTTQDKLIEMGTAAAYIAGMQQANDYLTLLIKNGLVDLEQLQESITLAEEDDDREDY